MPLMSSCASGRQRPPASSACSAYTTLPPETGFAASGVCREAVVDELLASFFEEQATSNTSATSTPHIGRSFDMIPPDRGGAPALSDRDRRSRVTALHRIASRQT